MASVKNKKPATMGRVAQLTSDINASQRELIDKAGTGFEQFIHGARQQSGRATELHARLRALGLEGLTTREQFRDAVRGTNLTTEDGAKRFAELMALANDFASLTPPIEEAPSATLNAGRVAVDSPPTKEEDQPMSATDQQVLDARLETIETRMDGRVSSIEASISAFLGRQDERFGRLDDRLVRMEQVASETQQDIKSLKSTIIVTAISVVLAIVLGVAAFNATVLSNMLASFESGKNTATAQAEVKKQSEETAVLIKRMRDDLDSSRAAAPPPPQKP